MKKHFTWEVNNLNFIKYTKNFAIEHKIYGAQMEWDVWCGVQERFKKLIEINESLGLNEDLIGPTQTLIKEGRITKISAKSGLPQERYLYLVCFVTFNS